MSKILQKNSETTEINDVKENNDKIIIYNFKNELSNLLGIIKLNYDYYSGINENLDIIINKTEELILDLSDIKINNKNNKDGNNEDNNSIKLFELFYLFITINTNSTFYELFFKIIIKFIRKIKKLEKIVQKEHLSKFKNYYSLIYTSLLEKKYEYINIQNECNLLYNSSYIIYLIIKIYNNANIYIDNLQAKNLFIYFFQINIDIYKISRSLNTYVTNEKYYNLIIKTYKIIFKKEENIANDILLIYDIILNKIIEISLLKDDNNIKIDDIEESFYVDTLILCLRLICKILKQKKICEKLTFNNKIKLIKSLIELSFWDNPNIVNYTCKIFLLIFKLSIIIPNFSMRQQIEKLFDFIYLRHFKLYYKFLEDDNIIESEKKIKLAVIEILIRNFNNFINESNYLGLLYFTNDLYKIRFNIISEIFKEIKNYFYLKEHKYLFLKNLLIITYNTVFSKIYLHIFKYNNIYNSNSQFFIKFEEFSDYWLQKIKLIKEGNFKELYHKICIENNLYELKKNDNNDILPREQILKYKLLAKQIAIIIRYTNYVDNEKLYFTLAENNLFSKMILSEYVNTYNFKNLDIITAYNLYASTFKLTGESYNIYNFVCSFGSKYYLDNKEIFEKNKKNKDNKGIYFKNEEEVTNLAYAIMMLNTDQHNPNNLNRMTEEEFIKNNNSSGLFNDLPNNFFIQIYNEIHNKELKTANQRNFNYTKDNDIYLNFQSLENYLSINVNQFDYKSIFNLYENFNKNNDVNIFTKEVYPYINLLNETYIDEKKINENEYINLITYSYYNIFEEFLPLVISLPCEFFETNNELIISLLEKICEVALKINKKNIIDKIIESIYSILNNKKTKKNILTYNIFFEIVIKYNDEFHTHLEIYYKSILEYIYIFIKEIHTNPIYNKLRNKYINIIELLIDKSYNVIKSQKKNKNENVGFFNLLLFGDNNKNEFNYDEFKDKIYKKLCILPNIKSEPGQNSTKILNKININENKIIENNNSNIKENNSKIQILKKNKIKKNELISLEKILNKIKSKEEELIFFVTYLASQILEKTNDCEVIISIIFLNEFINNIPEKEFEKIWPNIFNIFKSKIEYNKINEDNIFQILFTNYYLTQTVKGYFNNVLNEDYEQLLDTYEEIKSVELLLVVLEINDTFIKSAITSKKVFSPQVIESLIFLMYKLFLQLTKNLKNLYESNLNTSNTTITINQLIQSINLFNSISSSIISFDNITTDALSRMSSIIKFLYENDIVKILSEFNIKILNISVLISILSQKIYSEISTKNENSNNEFLWSFLIYLGQLSLKSSLVENEETQRLFIENVLFLFDKCIPIIRYNQIVNILSDWHQNFINLKIKYTNFWKDIFLIFYKLMSNNNDIKNNTTEIESLWILLIKKFLISFIDDIKNKKVKSIKDEIMIVKQVYLIVLEIVNKLTNSQKLSWFESTKNTIKLYFPEILE